MTDSDPGRQAFDLQFAPAAALKGDLRLPGDKSISHRALLLAALAEGESKITGLSDGGDVASTKAAIATLGASCSRQSENVLLVRGFAGSAIVAKTPQTLAMGNSGTTTRLLAGMLAAMPGMEVTLCGDESLSKRPMRRVSEPLQAMGASIGTAEHGGLPLKIKGRALKACQLRLEVASAQVSSAILLAALNTAGGSCVYVPGRVRDHTELMLPQFGCQLQVQKHASGSSLCLDGPQSLQAAAIDIAGDISSAAFFMVAAALIPDSDILLKSIGVNPTRTAIVDILRRMGASIDIVNGASRSGELVADLRVRYSGRLRATEITPDEVPAAIDELPVLLVAAAAATGRSSLRGAAELRHKESDRIAAMAANLSVLGIKLTARDDGMDIEGGTMLGGTVDSFADHRIAMAMAVAGLASTDGVLLKGAQAVAVSLPGFVELLRQLGVDSIKVHYGGG